MATAPPKPEPAVMLRVETLLREQLFKLGEDLSTLQPHEISRYMHCGVHANGALSYSWKGIPILDVDPEPQSDGSLDWSFFVRTDAVQ